MTGGPIGFSCDIANLPCNYKEFWKKAIIEFKEDRDLYSQGNARILVDANDVIAIEYADKSFKKCILQVFTKNSHLTDLTIYPVVDETAEYEYIDKKLTGKDIKENGLTLEKIIENDCIIIRLIKK